MPAFSSPENVNVTILKLKNNKVFQIQIDTDNTFKNFINKSIETIEKKKFSKVETLYILQLMNFLLSSK